MFYYKILNLNNNGVMDYKTINIGKNVAGSQVYAADTSYCILANLEDVTHKDLVKLTHEQYVAEKAIIENEAPPSEEQILRERVEMLEAAFLETTTMLAMEQEKNNQNELAIIELTMLISGGN